jgi:hypothetical protein
MHNCIKCNLRRFLNPHDNAYALLTRSTKEEYLCFMWRSLIFLISVGLGYNSVAQPTKMVVRNPQPQQYNSPVLKCPVFTKIDFHKRAIGIKFGDPVAISYKYNETRHWAFVTELGKSTSGLYNKYYREAFNKSYLPDSLSRNQSVRYLSHQTLSDWFVEFKLLYQAELSQLINGLNLFAGVGSQWRNTNIRYNYIYEGIDSKGNQQTKTGTTDQSRFTYGLSVVSGLEYSAFSLPVSAFLEVEYFTDGLIDTGYQRFQGGVGLRYNF